MVFSTQRSTTRPPGQRPRQAGSRLGRLLFAGLSLATLAVLLPGEPGEDEGLRLTGRQLYDTRPVVVELGESTRRVTWVGYLPGAGDFLFTGIEEKGALSAVERLNSEPRRILRPVMARWGDRTLVAWTEGDRSSGSRIHTCLRTDGKWSAPTPLPAGAGDSLNPEVTALPGGRFAMLYQVYADASYHVALRILTDGEWGDEQRISPPVGDARGPFDSWDPVLAWEANREVLFLAWVGYFPKEYDLCWRTWKEGELGEVRRFRHEGYDLHPTALSDPQGGVWLAWDKIRVEGHGESGNTFVFDGPEREDGKRGKRLHCRVAAARWVGGSTLEVPQTWRVTDREDDVRHGGMPALGMDGQGSLYLAYRQLHNRRRDRSSDNGGRKHFYWDIAVRTLVGETWSPPTTLELSDGPHETPALASAGAAAMRVYYQRDYRDSTFGNDGLQAEPPDPEQLARLSFDHHADYGLPEEWHGDLYVRQIAGEFDDSERPRATTRLEQDELETLERAAPPNYERGPYRVLFGDLHKHTNISRCSWGTEPEPEDVYRYARDVGQVEFLAVTDHAGQTSDFNWWQLRKLAGLFDHPGEFTTLFGLEWNGPEGHKNVITPSPELPLLARQGVAPDAASLWAALAETGLPAITIPHTPAQLGSHTDWTAHDPRFERLVEIFQASRGSFEAEGAPRVVEDGRVEGRFVKDALALGYRLGFVASTDHGYGASYACVYATDNTREAIFEALHERRCYASTVYGLVLDFEVNGTLMGGEVGRSGGVTAEFLVDGTAPLARVDLLRDGEVVRSWKPDGEQLEAEWSDPSPGTGTRTYYLRVLQTDDEMAWSSPVWVVD